MVSRRIVLVEFAELEQKNIEEDMQRTVEVLNGDLEELNRTAIDYSMWDDTYRWMQQHGEGYVTSNYSDISLQNLKIRTVILLDKQRRVVFMRSVKPGGRTSRDGNRLAHVAECG